MIREQVSKEVSKIILPHVLCELPTGFGKSKVAIDRVSEVLKSRKKFNILIVVPRLVLIAEWQKEIKKWNIDLLSYVTFTTYISLPKHAGNWDFVIFDECHHLSERCRESLEHFDIKHSIMLSATVSNNMKHELLSLFPTLVFYKKSMKDAIESEVLPDPKVYLMPLNLLNGGPSETIIKNPKGKGNVRTPWATRWNFIKQKEYKVTIYCNQKQYLEDLNSQIEFWKSKYMRTRNEVFQRKWLYLCGQRLKWLSDKKVLLITKILEYLKNERTLTFCNNIDQTVVLGKHCINSKNKQSGATLELFNQGKVNHITACNMLNEGMNLFNCRIGLYANLNSSETIIKQRLGRILRHKDPIIIIPYYKNTREEELVEKMLEDYNPDLVKTISNVIQIKL